jgi:two-component system response regulator GlrR
MSAKGKVLVCDFHPMSGMGGTLRVILESSTTPSIDLCYEAVEVRRPSFDGTTLGQLVARYRPELAFLVLSPRSFQEAGTLFDSIRKAPVPVPIIVVIDGGEPDELFQMLKVGAVDFITAPLRSLEILPRVWRLLEKTRGPSFGGTLALPRPELKRLIGRSPAFLAELAKLPLVAKCEVAVLILGETGTGKELIARAVHEMSPRAGKPFVPVNCGAIPTDLVESELFGHERGAFTGASHSQSGLVREAESGTLFLDEVACLPLLAQAKLLRFLQESEYRPLGAARAQHADVRIIAATNTELEKAVSDGRFRQDLYYRLNVIPILLPPLRTRADDIPMLARHFLAKYAARFGKQIADISEAALRVLARHDWPGNIRELEHRIERAVVMCEENLIEETHLQLAQGTPVAEPGFRQAKANVVTQFEKNYIQSVLRAHAGNITRAAVAVKKNRRAFWQLIRKHGIDVECFKLPPAAEPG